MRYIGHEIQFSPVQIHSEVVPVNSLRHALKFAWYCCVSSALKALVCRLQCVYTQ